MTASPTCNAISGRLAPVSRTKRGSPKVSSSSAPPRPRAPTAVTNPTGQPSMAAMGSRRQSAEAPPMNAVP